MCEIVDVRHVDDYVEVETEDTIYCVDEKILLNWLREEDEMNYVYKVVKEDGAEEVMISQFKTCVGDVTGAGEVIEVIGEYTDTQLAQMLLETAKTKKKKRWGRK
ncbi:MAG TPA: hypothetical protein PKV93_07215 [Fervidobacterium sp.]|nr:hypothetical protein [Fervidobacterium sp.]